MANNRRKKQKSGGAIAGIVILAIALATVTIYVACSLSLGSWSPLEWTDQQIEGNLNIDTGNDPSGGENPGEGEVTPPVEEEPGENEGSVSGVTLDQVEIQF